MEEQVLSDDQKQFIEELKWRLIYPAKSKVKGDNPIGIRIGGNNYRFLSEGEISLRDLEKRSNELDLNFESELRGLAKDQFGQNFDIKFEDFHGYMGVSKDSYFIIT